MITHSGKAVFPSHDPRHTGQLPTIDDVARGLSAITRFAGQTEDHINVLEHSIFVSALCDPRFALLGLLHDAAEAVVGDCVGTWKTEGQSVLEHDLCLQIIRNLRIELGIDDTRFDYYFNSEDAWQDVDRADKEAVSVEAHILGHADPSYFPELCAAYGLALFEIMKSNLDNEDFVETAQMKAAAMVERLAKLEGVFDPEPESKPSLVTW